MHLVIDTYTEKLPHVDGTADGLLGAEYDTATGRFGAVTPLATARNPSYAAFDHTGRRLYVVHETERFEGATGGGVTAYRHDPATGALDELNSRPSGGDAACHLALDPSGRFVVVANYGGGSITVFPVAPDGSLGESSDTVHHRGSSIHPDRQTGPHPHMIGFDPVTGDLLVPDLGTDEVLSYRLGPGGRLTARPEATIPVAPGAGPRHLAFHPDGEHLFVVNELDSTVLTARRGGETFLPVAVTATLPNGFTGHNQASAIRVTPSGGHVLVANRGHDSLAVLRVDGTAGELTLVRAEPTLGREPRDFTLTPDGRFAVVADQDSDLLVSFRLDETASTLSRVDTVTAATPASLLFDLPPRTGP
ncbi:lactonase family protein [Pseudonocardia spinosispora]|uniref:lactonase family protein n=1 Tax=Pseudonocardia spinosispora TaxID=103441 RepID=UPI0004104BAE|nr:lactonase family protein [Pseudonocardia spinosispora]